MPARSTHLTAILWVLSSTALFTVIYAAAKFGAGTIGTFQILVLRYAGSFATLLILAAPGGLSRHRSSRPGVHLMRAVLGCGAAAAITWASAHMPIADATAIGILYGVFTVMFGIVFLGETVVRGHWVAVGLSLSGAVVVMAHQGAFQGSLAMVPVLVALLSAVLMSAEGVMIRVLSRAEPAMTLMLYVSGFGVLLTLGPALWEWQSVPFEVALACVALGPVGVLAQYCTIRGYRIAPLSVVGPVDYAWLIFAMIVGLIAFDEVPEAGGLIGGALIVVGGVVLARLRRPRETGA